MSSSARAGPAADLAAKVPPTAAPDAPAARSAADLLSVGRREQITKQLRLVAASGFISIKGKGRTRAPVYRSLTPSSEPSDRGGSNADEGEEVFDNVEEDDEISTPLIGVVKDLEE